MLEDYLLRLSKTAASPSATASDPSAVTPGLEPIISALQDQDNVTIHTQAIKTSIYVGSYPTPIPKR